MQGSEGWGRGAVGYGWAGHRPRRPQRFHGQFLQLTRVPVLPRGLPCLREPLLLETPSAALFHNLPSDTALSFDPFRNWKMPVRVGCQAR